MACRQAFWNLPKSTIEMLARCSGMEVDCSTSLFSALESIIGACLKSSRVPGPCILWDAPGWGLVASLELGVVAIDWLRMLILLGLGVADSAPVCWTAADSS